MLAYLFIAFIVIISIQCIYYLLIFGNFSFSKNITKQNKFKLPVSVIICSKNEADNLTENIPFFINQDYPDFELVLINDNSYDNTLEVIKEFKKKYPTIIKIVDVAAPNEQFWGSKKYALTLGIKAAKNEYLLFSDADCKPISKNWIQQMCNNFTQTHQIVLGYGAYKKIRKSLLNKLIRFETLLTAIQYFSFTKIGMPYMGVGRNLAYTKTTFFKANGFVNHMHLIKSGDDDLFVNQVATKKNTTYTVNPESFTISKPKITFKEWMLQKRRHISTASHYKQKDQFILGLFYSSQILFWLLGIILLSFQFNWIIVSSLMVFRLITVYLSVGYAAKKFKENDLIFLVPLYELLLIFIQMIIFIKNLTSKPRHW